MFRREIPREDVRAITEKILGAPLKGAGVVEIRMCIHHIEIFTVARDSGGHYIADEKGCAARDCHVIRIGGGKP